MITEDYCSYGVAKLLKEKGFNTSCMGRYSVRSKEFHLDCTKMCNNGGLFEYAAPTLQMVMKWLIEKHNLFIQVEYDSPTFSADIYKMDEVDEYGSAKHIPPTFANAKSYEETVEAALKYSLENLI